MTTPTPLQRLPDWPERLAAFFAARQAMPFAWGSNDCLLFAADAVLAITGTDLAADVRGLDERAALRHLQAAGGMAALLAAHLPAYATVLQAHRGDVVWCDVDGRPVAGVLGGNGYWCAPHTTGLVWRPVGEVAGAYAVGSAAGGVAHG